MLAGGVLAIASLDSAAASSMASSISSSSRNFSTSGSIVGRSSAATFFCFFEALVFLADGAAADGLVLFFVPTSEGIGSRVCPWRSEEVFGAL